MITTYETSDMGLAAYLTYDSFEIAELKEDPNRPGKLNFVFFRKPGTKIEDVVSIYNNKQARVEPIRFFNDVKHLKNLLYR